MSPKVLNISTCKKRTHILSIREIKLFKLMIHTAKIIGTGLVTRRTFSSTLVLKADPITTTVVATAALPAINKILIITIGIVSSLFAVFYTQYSTIVDFAFPLNLGFDYLEHLRYLNIHISSNLHLYNQDQLRVILQSYEAIIRIHEQIFNGLIPFINGFEGSPFFDDYNDLFEMWREQGNSIMETYRNIERLLDITITNSRIEPQLYED